MRSAAIALAVLAALAGSAAADIVLLTDGRIIEGRPMERVEGGVKVKFENGEILVPDRLIQDAVLQNDPALAPRTDEEKENAAKGLVRYEGRWITPTRRDELIQKRVEERKAQIEEIKAHAEWRNRYKEATKHFKFEYTVPPYIFEYYRDMMEAYFTEFAKTWRVQQIRGEGQLPVCLYTDRALFNQVSGAGGGTLAYFRFVPPREINFFYDRLDPVMAERVMFHETNHYLQLLLDSTFSMPHFPGEALAEYYGGSRYDPEKKKLEMGLVQEGRLVEVKDDILRDEPLGLEKMITTQQMYEHYNWGWSLVHYCMSDPKLQKRFETYVRTLVNGRGVKRVPANPGMTTVLADENWRVFKQCMGLKTQKDVEEFEKAWHQYCKDLKIESASGLAKAAYEAAQHGQPIKARRLYAEAIEKGGANGLTYHRYATLLVEKEPDKAIEMWRKAIELDPLEAQFYVALGRELVRAGQKDEGKKLVDLAKELDPDNPWLDTDLSGL